MDTSYIEDGANERFHVAPVPGIHGGLRGDFRPATYEERRNYLRGGDRLTPEEERKRVLAILKGKLLSWNLLNANGLPIVCTPDNALRLKPILLERLLLIILGADASDPDPDAAPAETEAAAADRL